MLCLHVGRTQMHNLVWQTRGKPILTLPQELNVWQLFSASLGAPRGPGMFHQRSSQTYSDHPTR